MDMSVNIAGVEWKNPVTVASGTFGSGEEFSEYVDLNRLGAVTTKGVANVPWSGNPTPRVAEVYGGMMNAIGLQNPGIDLFCKRDIPFLKQYDTKIIVNVCGHAPEEYLAVVERLADEPIDMMEINISCPNVNAGFLAFGQDAHHVEELTGQIKKIAKQPVIMKLTPNVTDITEIAKAAEAGGADAVSLINTLTGMKIDINRKTFALANKTGGVSGPDRKTDCCPHGLSGGTGSQHPDHRYGWYLLCRRCNRIHPCRSKRRIRGNGQLPQSCSDDGSDRRNRSLYEEKRIHISKRYGRHCSIGENGDLLIYH